MEQTYCKPLNNTPTWKADTILEELLNALDQVDSNKFSGDILNHVFGFKMDLINKLAEDGYSVRNPLGYVVESPEKD